MSELNGDLKGRVHTLRRVTVMFFAKRVLPPARVVGRCGEEESPQQSL